MSKPDPFSAVLGRNLRRRRLERGLQQEHIAGRMVSFGFGWTQATVSALETGRQVLSLQEAICLQAVLELPLSEMLASPDGAVTLGGLRLPASTWHQLTTRGKVDAKPQPETLGGMIVPRDPNWSMSQYAAISQYAERRRISSPNERIHGYFVADIVRRYPQLTAREVRTALADVTRLADRRVARKLKVDPIEVSIAAQRLWGHGLSEERDSRVERTGDEWSDRMKAAHVTRVLQQEVAAAIRPRRKPK